MQYSIGVEYALHCLVYLIDIPEDSPTGIKELSFFKEFLIHISQKSLVNYQSQVLLSQFLGLRVAIDYLSLQKKYPFGM